MEYQYAVVQILLQIGSRKTKRMSQQLEDLININSEKGWEYLRVDNIDTEIKAGCIASLFGGSSSYTTNSFVVFRRPA